MIEKLHFGRTGHLSTRTLFGAAALGNVTQAEADATLETLLEYGVNHIDTAASYGAAEERIGPWMEKHRGDFFLATKTEKRTYGEAREQIRRSLERMRVSQLDLIQLHCLVEMNEWEVAMGEGGALQAAIEAREEGLVRFIGVTGHGVNVARMHLKSLECFDFDSVLLPWNYAMSQNEAYADEFEQLGKVCAARNVAFQTIKAVSRRHWNEDAQRFASTWYEPLQSQSDIDDAVHWLLGHGDFFLNTPGDIHILPRVLEAASRFEEGRSEEQMSEMAQKSAMAPLFV
ncbi:MAG TPA: aldo/keto reductase [Abditibacterium sp.]|jgi:aryl-alcohol dehydrogenase-like predicted oxidoreductase